MSSGMIAIAASLLRGRIPRGVAGSIGAPRSPFAPVSDPPRGGRVWTTEVVSRHAASATLLLSPLDFILSCLPPDDEKGGGGRASVKASAEATGGRGVSSSHDVGAKTIVQGSREEELESTVLIFFIQQ